LCGSTVPEKLTCFFSRFLSAFACGSWDPVNGLSFSGPGNMLKSRVFIRDVSPHERIISQLHLGFHLVRDGSCVPRVCAISDVSWEEMVSYRSMDVGHRWIRLQNWSSASSMSNKSSGFLNILKVIPAHIILLLGARSIWSKLNWMELISPAQWWYTDRNALQSFF
jgi:hypothetical protein